MIETAARRRSVGDWRGACTAADVIPFFQPDSVRRRYGREVADSLLADLRALAPDLLRWHLPRCGHGTGQLLEGLLIPLADYPCAGGVLTLAAATPRFALAAGQRVVLTVVDCGGCTVRGDPGSATRTLLSSLRRSSAERYDLRRHCMFWDADRASGLCGLCPTGIDEEITRLQDEGSAADAWAAAGFELSVGPSSPAGGGDLTAAEQRGLMRWLATLPVNLPRLAQRVRAALPDADRALIRCGGGVIALSGLGDRDGPPPHAEVCSVRAARNPRSNPIPTVPEAAWARPVDADLLRLGMLGARDLHPLVASALSVDSAAPEPADEWRYATALGIVSQYTGSGGYSRADGGASVLVRCGDELHRVAQVDGRWQAVDHDDHARRELLLARLGGRSNPCRTAARYLGDGRHVIELVDVLMAHGRVAEATRLLTDHADAAVAPEEYVLPDGSTVGRALDSLRENTLRLNMIRAGAPPVRGPQSAYTPRSSRPSRHARRSRKGDPALPRHQR